MKDLLEKHNQIFQSINESGLKFSPTKCEFDVKSLQFFDNFITARVLKPDLNKMTKFLNHLEMPRTTKQLKMIDGFLNVLLIFIPKLQRHFYFFYKLFKNNMRHRSTMVPQFHYGHFERPTLRDNDRCSIARSGKRLAF